MMRSTSRRAGHCRQLLLHLAEFVEYAQRRGGLVFIDPAHRETDMDQNPIADAVRDRSPILYDAGDIHLALYAAHIDDREFALGIRNSDDPARNSQTHGVAPISWLVASGGPYGDLAGCCDNRLSQRQTAVIHGDLDRKS